MAWSTTIRLTILTLVVMELGLATAHAQLTSMPKKTPRPWLRPVLTAIASRTAIGDVTSITTPAGSITQRPTLTPTPTFTLTATFTAYPDTPTPPPTATTTPTACETLGLTLTYLSGNACTGDTFEVLVSVDPRPATAEPIIAYALEAGGGSRDVDILTAYDAAGGFGVSPSVMSIVIGSDVRPVVYARNDSSQLIDGPLFVLVCETEGQEGLYEGVQATVHGFLTFRDAAGGCVKPVFDSAPLVTTCDTFTPTPTRTFTPTFTPTVCLQGQLAYEQVTGDPCGGNLTTTMSATLAHNPYGHIPVTMYLFMLRYDKDLLTPVAAWDAGNGFGVDPMFIPSNEDIIIYGFNTDSRFLEGELFQLQFVSSGMPYGSTTTVALDTLDYDVIYGASNTCISLPEPIITAVVDCPEVAGDDADADRILDLVEANPPALGQTNMYLHDSDGDALTDGYEDANYNGGRDPGETDPRNRDTDGDGLWDSIELYDGTNPLSANDPIVVTDADGDGLPAWLDPDDAVVDVDGDKYTDGYERVAMSAEAVESATQYPALGDANRDGRITNVDSLIVQAFFLRVLDYGDPYNLAECDPNRDAFISNADALLLASYFLGTAEYLPF